MAPRRKVEFWFEIEYSYQSETYDNAEFFLRRDEGLFGHAEFEMEQVQTTNMGRSWLGGIEYEVIATVPKVDKAERYEIIIKHAQGNIVGTSDPIRDKQKWGWYEKLMLRHLEDAILKMRRIIWNEIKEFLKLLHH